MRLSKIKLAGFKSFVEPTTVPLPGNIVGVVGPNGCGKSNIIDAVRWVMGESSAKYLRGESIVDVIFNGSESRKPVSTASIELVFDNSDAAIGGKYAAYNEISLRRQVNREGQSAYYFNGTRCRRRDITDVFLGTGLGPRSYSIIEQSMIARLIEARPEELRAHLEEAAGISVYRERRKETERRMHDTLENLGRLDDILSELGRQLDKLKRQAQAAERYRALKVEHRERQAQLYALRLQALIGEQESVLRQRSTQESELEAGLARQRELDSEVEQYRARYVEGNDCVNELQAQCYAAASEITRLEQQIQHRREMREASRQELERNREALSEVERSLEEDGEKLAKLKAEHDELAPAVNEAVAAEQVAREAVESLQHQLEEWRHRWDRFSDDAAQALRVVQVERARIDQLEQRCAELAQRDQRLQQEAERLLGDDPQAELEALDERERVLLEQRDELQADHQAQQEEIDGVRERMVQLSTAIDEIREAVHRDRARLTSLETIQQAALGEDEALRSWLERVELASEPRLSQSVEVQPGWELAVETVLGSALQAIVTECAWVGEEAGRPPSAGAVMLFRPGPDEAPVSPQLGSTPALRDKVSAPWALDDLLGRVYCVDDLSSACTLAADLEAHESIVTPDGTWLGRRWLRVPGTNNPAEGAIARQRELESLHAGVADWEERLTLRRAEYADLCSKLTGAESGFEARREALAALQGDLTGIRARVESLEHRRKQFQQRRVAIDQERAEIAAARQDAATAIRSAGERLQEATERSESLARERPSHREERERLQEQLATEQERFHELQSRRHELSLQEQSVTTARTALEESAIRLQERRQRLLMRDGELDEALGKQDLPEAELESERERLAAQRPALDERLLEARAQLDESERALREREPRRSEASQRVAELRSSLETVRLREQELKLRAQTQAEQLDELGYDRETVTTGLDPELTERACAEALSRLEGQINRIEPVNLAAIDECRDLEERKAYLERQHGDLRVALQTLDSAIRHIEQETRRRFKETFEQVDQRLRVLFPRLFGGGQAHLELSGEDLLEAAITIMARPPGKKITSIQLLSSGEKALTAVSLIFALFELNPAPFCMLDEVDAPLDEANVGRFCDMLREQSERVQFIMVTHNKSTMQAASHLLGITMNEPGVSRLVAVDLARAAELAAV